MGAGDMTPNAVAGDPIEVTALGAPQAPAAEVTATAPVDGSALPAETAVTTLDPAALPVTAEATAQGVEPAVAETVAPTAPVATEAEAAEAAPPPPPKSELQIACERKRGTWTGTGSGLKICIRQTRDGGKRCTRESQCEGLCLARSGTCAPMDPVLGCQEILQDDGSRATQCIE
jgi:hypothetical protein